MHSTRSLFSTDGTCSELKPGLTDEEIENCPYSFYKNIAYYMKQGKYPAEFRIQEYKAWPPSGLPSQKHIRPVLIACVIILREFRLKMESN